MKLTSPNALNIETRVFSEKELDLSLAENKGNKTVSYTVHIQM